MPDWVRSKTVIGLPNATTSSAHPDATEILIAGRANSDSGYATRYRSGTTGIRHLCRDVARLRADEVPDVPIQCPLMLAGQRLVGIVGTDGLIIRNCRVGICQIAILLLCQIGGEDAGGRVIVVILTVTIIVCTQEMIKVWLHW